MILELADCENTLMREIEDRRMKQRDVAITYGLTLRSSERARVDWYRVNTAIIERWSPAGLENIKRLAWKGPQ
jgi:hypothetical protein